MKHIVEIRPLARVSKDLSYGVPEEMVARVQVGSLVLIPLMNRQTLGIVSKLGSSQEIPVSRLKPIKELLYDWPVMTPDLVKMAAWMQTYYASSLESLYELMIPAEVRNQTSLKLVKFLKIKKDLTDEELQKLARRGPKQAVLYEFLQGQADKRCAMSVCVEKVEVGSTTIKSLLSQGVIEVEDHAEHREAYADESAQVEMVSSQEVSLTEEQQTAVDDICASIDKEKFQVHLLHGVTGSGKTEVYLRAMQHVLATGGGILFLVPEVALTPQTIGRVRARLAKLNVNAVVWHSHLSKGEKFDAWFALAKNKAHVVVGARSAVFAPIQNLKLIIVDEEHEPAYKQAEIPRYHGRDTAVYRAMLCKATCILGSATPSLESLYNVQVKDYKLNKLAKRIDDRQLPRIHLVDMKRELFNANSSVLMSQMLLQKLWDRFEKKEQSILFLNRRGYSSSMLCPDCGFSAVCEHCSVTLTYHRVQERLRCHICNHDQPAPSICPKCKSQKIRWKGFGTQRVEELLAKVIPKAKVVRIDADTMSQKNRFREVLADFRTGKIDILVGTQMIAKGLDFPNVTLVGLLDADLSLHMPDFRANERAFQLIVQVSGRAGRGDRAGEVVIQTFNPQSSPIQFARRNDFDGFLDEELAQRKECHYPPFRHIIRHIFRGHNPEKVSFFIEKWAEVVQKELHPHVELRGPAPAPLEKAKDYYRFHLWFFTHNVSKVLPSLLALRQKFSMDSDILDVIDVDPFDLM